MLLAMSAFHMPTIAQTHSSFFKVKKFTFNTMQDSFSPNESNLNTDFRTRSQNTVYEFVDKTRETNQLNSGATVMGHERAILGAKNENLGQNKTKNLLHESIRTTRTGCFVTQAGSTNCN